MSSRFTPEQEELAAQMAGIDTNVLLQMRISELKKQARYEHLLETREFLQNILKETTGKETLDGWIVCGSGLASLPDSKKVNPLRRIPVGEIPHWFGPQAPGHGKEVIIANVGDQLVGIATGRAHIYDTNNSPEQLHMITSPLVVAKSLGIDWLVTTNAAGALDNGQVKVGDVAADVDYVNHHGVNPFIGPNDDRLGPRFPGKANIADPVLYSRLEQFIPADRLHLGIYSLASNTPFYEGGGDLVKGMYPQLTDWNPELLELYGMSFAMEGMVMGHSNNPPVDENGFDRPVRWIGLTAVTNVIPKPVAPTKEMLRQAAIPNPNPTSHEEVLAGGKISEELLIPAVIDLAGSITKKPLPAL